MTTILNFKKSTIIANSIDDVKNQVNFSLDAKGANATQAFKNWETKQTGEVTDAMIKTWMVEHLDSKFGSAPGLGCYIVKTPAVTDKREHPYKKINVKNEDGKREWDTIIRVEGVTSGKVYATVTVDDVKKGLKKEDLVDEKGEPKTIRVKKADADKIVKDLYCSGNLTEDVNLFYNKVPRKKSQALAASYKYTPSKGTCPGNYIVFGIEA